MPRPRVSSNGRTLVPDVAARLASLELALQHTTQRLREAENRAALAERSAREAWQTAKAFSFRPWTLERRG